jgi:hypothetical protein
MNLVIMTNLFVKQITNKVSSSEESYHRPRESVIRIYTLTKADGSYSQTFPRIDQIPINQMGYDIHPGYIHIYIS